MMLQNTSLNVLAKYYHCILHSGIASLLLLSPELHHSLNCSMGVKYAHTMIIIIKNENGIYMDTEHQFFVA